MYIRSFCVDSYSMAILVIDYILTISWWVAVILSMPTILSFAENYVEHSIILVGILVLLLIPLAFTKL